MVKNELIWVPYNTPALKNSKVKTSRGIFSSPTVKKYLRKLGIQSYSSGKKTVLGYVTRPNEFEKLRQHFEKSLLNKGFPVLICFHFVRDSKRLFDFGFDQDRVERAPGRRRVVFAFDRVNPAVEP